MTKLVNESSVTAAELTTVKADLELSIQSEVNARILPIAI